jgi:hypothetical protein
MFTRSLPAEYRERGSSLQPWVACGYDLEATGCLLSILSRAFRLSESDGLRLRPEDKVWALYHTYYPRPTGWRRWIGSRRPDELEMETLLRDIERASSSVIVAGLPESVTVGDRVELLQPSTEHDR